LIVYGRIVKANLSWSPTLTKFFQWICKFICCSTPT